MQIFTVVEIIILLIYTILLVREYASKRIHFGIKALVGFSWFLSYSIIILVPLDTLQLANHQANVQAGISQQDLSDLQDNRNFLQFAWRVVWWSNQVLTWILLPIFQDYENAGQFTKKGRFKQSLFINGVFYLVVGCIGLIFVIYQTIKTDMKMSQLLSLAMALSNIFGIFLIIMLMGFGLVKVPQNNWYHSKSDRLLNYYYFEAVTINEKRNSSKIELEDLVKLIYTISENQDYQIECRLCAKDILRKVPHDIFEEVKNEGTEQRLVERYEPITKSKIITFHSDIKKKIMEQNRAECSWEELLEEVFLLNDIKANQNSADSKIHSVFWSERDGSCGSFMDKLGFQFLFMYLIFLIVWFWHVKLKVTLSFVFCILTALFSIIIFTAEITIQTDLFKYVFEWILPSNSSFMKTQIICIIPLLYINFVVYYSLFKLQISGFFGFYHHSQTDSPSLLFFATLTTRIAGALCYNFLSMIKIKERGNPVFYEIMGDVDNVQQVGTTIMNLFPLLLIILCLVNLFNIYSRFMTWIGLKRFSFSEDFSDEKIEEGKKLLSRARNRKEKQFQNMSTALMDNYHGYSSEVYLSSLI